MDGPVASGKTTVGRELANRLGYLFVDTGVFYRAVTLAALDSGVSLADDEALSTLAESLDLRLIDSGEGVLIDGVDVTGGLRTPEVEAAVSTVSRVAGVRRAMLAPQRDVAQEGGVVMVGRDIGSVVLTDARTKVYLDASVRVRAKRRHIEMLASGAAIELDQVVADTLRRDKIDSGREEAPLLVADDAVVILTDNLTLKEVAERIVNLVEQD